jgi:hypothetical protein
MSAAKLRISLDLDEVIAREFQTYCKGKGVSQAGELRAHVLRCLELSQAQKPRLAPVLPNVAPVEDQSAEARTLPLFTKEEAEIHSALAKAFLQDAFGDDK